MVYHLETLCFFPCPSIKFNSRLSDFAPPPQVSLCPPVPAPDRRGPPSEAGAGEGEEQEKCRAEDEHQGVLPLQSAGPGPGEEGGPGGEDLPRGCGVLGGHHHGGEPRDQHQAEQEV